MTPPAPVVAFCLREDGRRKGGGDVIQMEATARALMASGVHTEVTCGYTPSLLRARVIHLTNLDRPHDMLAVAAALSRDGWRGHLYLNSIHHPHRFTEGIVRSVGARGALRQAIRASWPVDAGLGALRYGRAARPDGASPLTMLRGLRSTRSAQRALLAAIRGCVVLSDDERAALTEDFGYHGPTLCVPNGVSPEVMAGADEVDGTTRAGIAVVGRIEARKNSLRLARLLASTGLPASFAGALNPNEPRFGAEFLEVIAAAPTLSYLGTLPPREIGRLLGRSRLHVLASRAEVFPLVDIEALACGTPVITTTHSLSVAHLAGHAQIVNPERLTAELITSAYHQDVPAAVQARYRSQFTWEAAAGILRREYARIGVLPTPTPSASA